MRRVALLYVLPLAVVCLFSSAFADSTASKDKQALLDRGIAEKEKNQFDEAIADFDRAIALDPKWAAAYEYRGATYAAKFEATEDPTQVLDLIDKAIADYDTVIGLNAATARTYTLHGVALSDREDYKAAIADYDRALELDPKFDPATRARDYAAAQLREQQRALTLTGDLLRFQPRNVELLLMRAGLLVHQGRHDEALRDLDKVLEIDPKNESALALRAELTRATGAPKEIGKP